MSRLGKRADSLTQREASQPATENFQFPPAGGPYNGPAGGPRIRKLKIFAETGKTEKTGKTENVCSIFVGFPSRK